MFLFDSKLLRYQVTHDYLLGKAFTPVLLWQKALLSPPPPLTTAEFPPGESHASQNTHTTRYTFCDQSILR